MNMRLLLTPELSYITGFIQTDGSHSGDPERKGRISIELAARDEVHLESIAGALPWKTSLRKRTRQTNFSTGDYSTTILNLFAQEARRFFAAAGVPPGRKSGTVGPPSTPFVGPDYVRGIIDGDGSIGFTANGYPFVSVVTASERLATYLCEVIAEVCAVRRTARRNTRDNVYNIMVTSTAAQALVAWCYYERALALPRKAVAASEVSAWTRPAIGSASQNVAGLPTRTSSSRTTALSTLRKSWIARGNQSTCEGGALGSAHEMTARQTDQAVPSRQRVRARPNRTHRSQMVGGPTGRT